MLSPFPLQILQLHGAHASVVRSFVIVIGIQWIRNMKPDDEGRRKEEGEKEGNATN